MARATKFEKLHLDEELKLYEALEKVLIEIGDVALWGFVGPYGSGKDSIMSWLAVNRPDLFHRVVGDTNRSKGKDDKEGETHHFRTSEEMKTDLLNQRFVQVAPSDRPGIFYATRPQQYNSDKINMKAIYAREMATFRKLGFREVKWLQIVPPNDEIWQAWQDIRDHRAVDKTERDAEAIQSYTLALLNRNTVYIRNDEIKSAGEQIVQIAAGREPRDQPALRKLAVSNLESLKKRLGKNT
ncbi:MAG: hypothetical protein AAB541_00510 [Patescibacteria group bacterium]